MEENLKLKGINHYGFFISLCLILLISGSVLNWFQAFYDIGAVAFAYWCWTFEFRSKVK